MLVKLLIVLWLSGSCVLAQQSNANLLQRYSQEGERALAEKRYGDAAKAFEKLRALAPGTAEVHATLGLIYFQQREFTQAVRALRQALKLKPDLPNADVLLAMCLSELGHHDEALPGLQKGFRQSPDTALKRSTGLQLQRAYTGLQRDSEAVEVALELTRLYPEDPEVLYHGGRLFANFAYLTTLKLTQVAPASVWTHQAAGEAYESQGNHDLAVSEYRAVLALDPGRPGIHFRLGRVLLARSERTGSPEEALKEFEQELQVDPTNANAAYELGEIHHKRGELEKAREFFEIALKHYPDFEEAQIGLGRVLTAMRKPDLALPHLQKAVSLNPENEVSYYQLSLVYRALGNGAEQKKALAEYERLRNQQARQQESVTLLPRQVTKQELDSEAVP
jgi:tetratricopeptide (TPR) repeat protein